MNSGMQQVDKKAQDAILVVERGITDETVQFFTLVKPVTIIGRPTMDSNPDIKLNDPQISRNHAEVCLKEDGFWLRDLSSKNGTILNGRMIEKEKLYQLADNSVIGLAIFEGNPRAILRFKKMGGGGEIKPVYEVVKGPTWLRIDDERKEVWIDSKPVDLPKKEYDLLFFLYRRTGKVCSRDEIIAEVWSEVLDPGAVSDATIDQLVRRLREKVEPVPSKPTHIVSKRRFGYLLV